MENNYYVYGYIRLDNNSYFYIGKGKRYSSCQTRYLDLSHRNKHFINIINKVPCAVEILYDNLTEEDASRLECETIEDLVFIEGYSIEVKGIKKEDFHLVNQTWGGEGASGRIVKQSTKDKISNANKGKFIGENNPNYGKHLSQESKKRISEANKINSKGKNNAMYGKKHSNNTKDKIGEANGKQVYCKELDMTFRSITKASEYIRDTYDIKFTKRTLIRKLKYEDGAYGKIEVNGNKILLHWFYC